MSLAKGDISTPLKIFINDLNKTTQKNRDKAIELFCDKIESVVFNAIKKTTITIKPGDIRTQGASVQTNITPLVINKALT